MNGDGPARTRLVSVVGPVCNEVGNLEPLLDEVRAALDPLVDVEHEIVLVDDGSSDGSWELACSLADEHDDLRVFRFDRSRGQSAALLAAIARSRGDVVVTLDTDLQNDPADIPRLLGALRTCDMVAGVRVDRQDSWARRVASRLGNAVRRAVLGDGFSDIGCSLRAVRSSFVRDLPPFDGMHRYLPVFVAARGARCQSVPVAHRPRAAGESKYEAFGARLRAGWADLLGVRWLLRRPALLEPDRFGPETPVVELLREAR